MEEYALIIFTKEKLDIIIGVIITLSNYSYDSIHVK